MVTGVVLSVGQCSADHSSITRLIKSAGGEIVKVDLHADLGAAVARYSPNLILINRINDSDGSSGIACIKELRLDRRFEKIPLMLVSDLPEAQAEAVKNGAVRGFGKSRLYSAETVALIQQQLRTGQN